MEQHPDINELLRNRLYDAEVPPPAFVWPNVERALRKKKRRIFFWIFGSVCAAGLAYGGWQLLNQTTLSDLNPPISTVDLPAETLNAATTDNKTTAQVNATPTPETTGLHNAAGSELPAQKITTYLNTLQSLSHNAVLPNQSTPKQGLSNVLDINFPTPATTAGNPETISGAADPEITLANNVENQDIKPGLPLPLANQPEAIRLASLNALPLAFKPLLFGSKLSKPGGVPFKIIRHKKEHKACYDFGKHPNVWMVDAYAGPAFAFKELSTNNPEFQHYLERRQDTEHRDWAFNAGVRGTLMLEQHFMLRFGLHYDQMTEVFELIDPNSINVSVTYSYKYDANGHLITDTDGNPISVADTIGVSYGENYFKSFNRFGMLDIPIQLGVELRKGRMGFNINAGFSFNILFWKQGAYLTPGGSARYFTPGGKNTTEIFRTRTGLSAIGSVQWFYHLQPRLRIFAEPYFRQIVQPVNLKTHPIGQRYGVGGIRFGITKILD